MYMHKCILFIFVEKEQFRANIALEKFLASATSTETEGDEI